MIKEQKLECQPKQKSDSAAARLR